MTNEMHEMWEELLVITQQFRAMASEVNTSNPYVQPLADLEKRIAQHLRTANYRTVMLYKVPVDSKIRVDATKLIHRMAASLSLAESLEIVRRATTLTPIGVRCASHEEAEELAKQLRALGVDANGP